MSEQQALQSLCLREIFFAIKTDMALNEQELRSVEEEKQLFLKEIGLEEDELENMFKAFVCFSIRAGFALTAEKRQSIEEERSLFFNNEKVKAALEKYVRKKPEIHSDCRQTIWKYASSFLRWRNIS